MSSNRFGHSDRAYGSSSGYRYGSYYDSGSFVGAVVALVLLCIVFGLGMSFIAAVHMGDSDDDQSKRSQLEQLG